MSVMVGLLLLLGALVLVNCAFRGVKSIYGDQLEAGHNNDKAQDVRGRQDVSRKE